MRISGHSLHASRPDWSRAIGRNPAILGHDGALVVLSGQLAHGFDVDEDADALELWLRDAAAKQEATAACSASSGQSSRACGCEHM